MYCPKCGKENPEDARFCMYCGADLSGYKVEISPRIEVKPTISPTIQMPPSHKSLNFREASDLRTCDICGERKAVVTCKECGRRVCNYHFESRWKSCTLCAIAEREATAEYFEIDARYQSPDIAKHSRNLAKECFKEAKNSKENFL